MFFKLIGTYLLGFFNILSQDSDHNLVIFNRVKDELYHSYGGEGKWPWTVLQMKGKISVILWNIN
jgi:hypothetical protein